ncbi:MULTISPECIES: tyrosine-type recombinase/integrase [Bacteroides]|uniref:tyrosine-type recombinase/integrase n=4 Tax=Bacteroides TaxID=816 RepID=UPI0023F8CF8D|nr:site-specific integrase [Bacteroides congonensis]
MKKKQFTNCANEYIDRLRREGRYSTAHVYKHAIRSFTKFCGSQFIAFSRVNRDTLKAYSNYLAASHLKPNTISTYMRMLRCIYNRGVDSRQAPYVYGLFRDVFTGVDTRQKKALPIRELHVLLNEDPKTEKLRRTQAVASLLFQFCGMPFVDFAHLEKSNVEQGLLKYNRMKTGTPMSLEILDSAQDAIARLCNGYNEEYPDNRPNYLFRILSGEYKRTDEKAYREYQTALRRFNNDLKCLSRQLRIRSSITSYTLRHSWATTAKYRGVPIEMISESLGHKSIKTTQIYLKGFELEERTKVNKMNYSYVKSFRML